MMHPKPKILAGRRVLAGFSACVAVLSLALSARGQSAAQSEGYEPCSTPSEVALADSVQLAAPTFSSFEAPGAGKGAGQGTIPTTINSAGVIAGYYLDSSGVYHGFVRTP